MSALKEGVARKEAEQARKFQARDQIVQQIRTSAQARQLLLVVLVCVCSEQCTPVGPSSSELLRFRGLLVSNRAALEHGEDTQ